jgi:hypothetical protein
MQILLSNYPGFYLWIDATALWMNADGAIFSRLPQVSDRLI